jgi:hypothetical protein
MNLAPVVIYTYIRLTHLRKTIDSLKANYLAKETTLIVVSDAASKVAHQSLVQEIRDYIDSIEGFKEIIKEFRSINLGTPSSILEAEYRLVNQYGILIALEDDNICAPNFLDFMNQGLCHFKNDESVFSICGYCPPVLNLCNLESYKQDVFTYPWNLSWGYAIWKDKYNKLMSLKDEYEILKRGGTISKLKQLGGMYIVDALKRDLKFNVKFPDAWLCAKMTHLNFHSVVPIVSKVKNIGSDGSGNHEGILVDKFNVVIDNGLKREFNFEVNSLVNKFLMIKMIKFYNGNLAGRIARYFGVYHHVLQLKKRLHV